MVRGVGNARAHSGDPASGHFQDLLQLCFGIEHIIRGGKSDVRGEATIFLINSDFIIKVFLYAFSKKLPLRWCVGGVNEFLNYPFILAMI
jgi:hypothetical protein